MANLFPSWFLTQPVCRDKAPHQHGLPWKHCPLTHLIIYKVVEIIIITIFVLNYDSLSKTIKHLIENYTGDNISISSKHVISYHSSPFGRNQCRRIERWMACMGIRFAFTGETSLCLCEQKSTDRRTDPARVRGVKKEKRREFPAYLMSGIASTASGLARADRSPVGLPSALALTTRRMIFPDLVLGTSFTKKTASG